MGPRCQNRLQGGARFACVTLNRMWIERGNFYTEVTILKRFRHGQCGGEASQQDQEVMRGPCISE